MGQLMEVKSVAMEIPAEKQYEYLTAHLQYINEKIIQSFMLFIKLATTIVGGTFYLHWKLGSEESSKRTSLTSAVDFLFICVGVGISLHILNNLRSWRDYREKLSNLGIKGLSRVEWWLSEAIMCFLIAITVGGFLLVNPLSECRPWWLWIFGMVCLAMVVVYCLYVIKHLPSSKGTC